MKEKKNEKLFHEIGISSKKKKTKRKTSFTVSNRIPSLVSTTFSLCVFTFAIFYFALSLFLSIFYRFRWTRTNNITENGKKITFNKLFQFVFSFRFFSFRCWETMWWRLVWLYQSAIFNFSLFLYRTSCIIIFRFSSFLHRKLHFHSKQEMLQTITVDSWNENLLNRKWKST